MFDDTIIRHATPTGARADGDKRWYHPERDLAYIGPELLAVALANFSEFPNPDPFYAHLLELQGATPDRQAEDLGSAAKALASFLNICVKGERTTLRSAAEEAGWLATLPVGIRAAILARLGEVLLGAIYAALQDVTEIGGEPPHVRSLSALLAEAKVFAERIQRAHSVA